MHLEEQIALGSNWESHSYSLTGCGREHSVKVRLSEKGCFQSALSAGSKGCTSRRRPLGVACAERWEDCKGIVPYSSRHSEVRDSLRVP